MDEEIVVAKKANLLVGSILVIVFGVMLIALGVIFGLQRTGSERLIFVAFFCVLGLVLIAVGIFQAVKYQKTPANLITYKDGLFHFADGTSCTPNEISNVLVKLTRRNGIVSPTGGIVISINNGRTITYNNVANVQQVQLEMQLITDDYNTKLYRERMVAAQPAQPAQPADPFAEIPAPAAPVETSEPSEPTDGGDIKSEN